MEVRWQLWVESFEDSAGLDNQGGVFTRVWCLGGLDRTPGNWPGVSLCVAALGWLGLPRIMVALRLSYCLHGIWFPWGWMYQETKEDVASLLLIQPEKSCSVTASTIRWLQSQQRPRFKGQGLHTSVRTGRHGSLGPTGRLAMTASVGVLRSCGQIVFHPWESLIWVKKGHLLEQ